MFNTMKAKDDKILKKCDQLFSVCSQNIEGIESWQNFLEIDAVLNSIMKLENAEVIETDRYNSLKDLTEWVKREGACIDNVSIAFFPNYGYGLRAISDINENELILQIPRKLIFNVNTAAPELEIFKSDIILKQMPNIALALALLFERSKNSSNWNYYIKSLPRTYSTVLYMKPQDLEILKGCSSLDGALKQIRNVARHYAYFKKILHKCKDDSLTIMKKCFTYENFRWAVSTVMTRQNMIPEKNGNKMILSLIPFWDMCNHEEGRITTNFNLSTNSCECFAMRNFNNSNQIFIHYGSRTNAEFFIHSGFVPENNHNDSFKLRLGISHSDPLRDQRTYLLNKLGLLVNQEYTLQPGKGGIPGSLRAFLRIFHFSKSELVEWMNSENCSELTESSCDINNDIHCKAISYIKVRLELLMQRYKSINEVTFPNGTQDLPLTRLLVWKMKFSEKNLIKNILSDIQIS